MPNYFESFIDYVAARNPNQPEYLQAVKEVAEDVIPYIEKHATDLIACKLFERITEPERTIS
ncbi:MAG TPA: hypothetical protein VNQ55_09695, partial [Parapedobacter sp.]|nr:hypothetical protein [Parapedobacter sp.]